MGDPHPNFLLAFWNEFTAKEKTSIVFNLFLLLALGTITLCAPPYLLILRALSIGGLGGLVHEFAQSGGKITFAKKYDDGLYIGSLAGTILGAVAGLLVIQGYVPHPGISPSQVGNTTTSASQEKLTSDSTSVNLGTYLEIFFAGLGLKGVIEAAGGTKEPGKLEDKKDNKEPTN